MFLNPCLFPRILDLFSGEFFFGSVFSIGICILYHHGPWNRFVIWKVSFQTFPKTSHKQWTKPLLFMVYRGWNPTPVNIIIKTRKNQPMFLEFYDMFFFVVHMILFLRFPMKVRVWPALLILEDLVHPFDHGVFTTIWSNYSDLTRPYLRKGNPLISGQSWLVKYYNLARTTNPLEPQLGLPIHAWSLWLELFFCLGNLAFYWWIWQAKQFWTPAIWV